MVKHIVFFKLSEEGLKNKDNIIVKLNNLKEDIDFIRALEVGVDFSKSQRAYDLALTVILDSKDDLAKYATHEKHIPVVEFLKSLNTVTKVVDYELPKKVDGEFNNAKVTKKANIYFNGQVTSRTIIDSDGTRKTLGIMMPGSYTFTTEFAEHMEILAGKVEVELSGGDSNWEVINAGEYFEVPANSSFDIKVIEVADYCCTYIQ
jgi:uncharacterized protein YaiE (UPF0345 family)